jgi:polyisoprenoid-binding protein YceI
MRYDRSRSWCVGILMVVGLALLLSAVAAPPHQQAPPAASREVLLTVDARPSSVHWTVDSSLHTVHGTFALRSGTIHFDPATGKAGGQIVVLATSGESGNSSRDARMHKEILETAKYPEATFRPTQVEGKVLLNGTSDVKVRGVLGLHGADHDVTANVHAEVLGDHWKGTAQFEVPYVDWGIKDPSNFFLKVKHVVHVELELAGQASLAK